MMSMIRAAQRVARNDQLVPRLAVAVRTMSIDTTLSERERAAEAVYFLKEERELIKRLAKKMGMPAKEAVATEEDALKKIFAKHKLAPTSAAITEIITYFHTHEAK